MKSETWVVGAETWFGFEDADANLCALGCKSAVGSCGMCVGSGVVEISITGSSRAFGLAAWLSSADLLCACLCLRWGLIYKILSPPFSLLFAGSASAYT
jgi:hypothetical protein